MIRRRRGPAAQVERLEEELRALSSRVAGLERSSATAREELRRLRELTVEREAERGRSAAAIADVHGALSSLEELLASPPVLAERH